MGGFWGLLGGFWGLLGGLFVLEGLMGGAFGGFGAKGWGGVWCLGFWLGVWGLKGFGGFKWVILGFRSLGI